MTQQDSTDGDWQRIQRGMVNGDVLATIATGPLTEQEAERAGLVPTHAYALLDMREVCCCCWFICL